MRSRRDTPPRTAPPSPSPSLPLSLSPNNLTNRARTVPMAPERRTR